LRRELAGLLDSVRRRGASVTLRLLASEIGFDAVHGTRTHGALEGEQLGALPPQMAARHLVYHAINPLVLRRCLDVLRGQRDGEAAMRGTFVDFGCGAGRALIIAARRGFGHVVGIECADALSETCQRNLAVAWRRFDLRGKYTVHRADATTFTVPDDSTVWLWFNPFDPTSARLVAERLNESLVRRPRKGWLLYAHPVQIEVPIRLGFERLAEVRLSPRHLDAVILGCPRSAVDAGR
jgi:SAM-dependent methyltransferase